MVPPTIGPRMVRRGRRRRPDPERARPLGAVEGMGDERQRARDEEGAGGTLGEAEDDQPLERRREAAQRGRRREADQADRVDPAPAVVVGQRARQDQQRGEDREVAADDVGLALEDADDVPGSSWPMCLSAALTMVPSRKTAPEPMTVQMSVQRWRVVMAGGSVAAGAAVMSGSAA